MVVEVKDKSCIAPLFAGWEETPIWSCLQNYMGAAYADELHEPQSAQLVIGDFCFFEGRPSDELLCHKPSNYPSEFIILVPQTAPWEDAITAVYGQRAHRRMRYATKKEGDVFDTESLENFAAGLPKPYELRRVDEILYRQSLAAPWSKDLCGQFSSYEDYQARGLGVAVAADGVLVSGASSYTVYREGIEIEVDTRQDHRRHGLALACSAKLILECRERGLYPSWDAHNKGSLALAKKLGYTFDRAYPVYEILDF